MCMQWQGHVTWATSAVGYVACHFEIYRSHVRHKDCAGAILYSTERAIEVAMEGMQCLGGNGYINGQCYHIAIFITLLRNSSEYPMGRILRDSRLYAVGAGTQEIRRMLIGREFNEQFKS